MRPFFQSVAGILRSSAATRTSGVQQARSETRSALTRHRAARLQQRLAIQRSLRTCRAARIESLRSTAAPSAAPRPGAPDVNGPEAPAGAARVGIWELWSEPGAHDETAAISLEAEVLRTIQAHPEGVRALDIGNELGMDWRRILVVTSTLIDAGVVEQIEQEFYPVAKASRRW